jgi:hypothetical protein
VGHNRRAVFKAAGRDEMELLDVERSIVVVIDLQGKLMEMAHR